MNTCDIILSVVGMIALLPFLILIVGGSVIMVKELIEEITTPKNKGEQK